MKFKILSVLLILLSVSFNNPLFAEKEKRGVATFTEVALRIDAKLYIEQGSTQSVEVIAKSSSLEEIITEVKGRELIIRFPNNYIFKKNFSPGRVEIHITVPEIDGLSVSGSGTILIDDLESRILDLAVSGSGNINIGNLEVKRLKCSISGSGDINIKEGGVAEELSASISGSGDINAINFEANNVVVRTSGSGNCSITSNGAIKARIAGSGDVNYKGNPSIDSSVAGSGRVQKRE